ncbi:MULTISPECIES: hypothetical protein [Pseudomonas syringae group]|uniref:hypothetical protein n=1 Tax=Pseudomonas syringae group TaxID=136849 RepID=UPI0009AF2C44|nr:MULTISPECIES: hypothetical protein [Pseudomonas syringae group]ARA80302.1 hypothetical protein B5U27_09650 [Pseudomonas amygdali pv. lachrymans]MCK9715230.1 hypothetical protein [Pseudomonas syringae pv. syringae]MCK9761312.1 hypothetical protein [Pseudomonas syringae pv. syringae]
MEELDPQSLQFKEMCAYYGAAMHMAQVLEHGIVNALFFLDFLPRKRDWTDEEYEDFFEENFSKTFGKLVHSLKKITTVPADLESLIHRSNKRRNHLAHTFFRESMDVLYAGGFDEIVTALNKDIELFSETDKRLTALLEPLWLKAGWTLEAIEAEALKYKAELKKKRSESV